MFDTLQNKARKVNQHAMVAKKRIESRGESRGEPKQKWLEDRKISEICLTRMGFICNKHTCLTQQTAQANGRRKP
jgi:hypothetical protein